MSQENKVISIAVGDKIKIEGVGTVELVVVAPEQPKQHPIVGKWVRCVNNQRIHECIFNKWYPIEGVNEKGSYYIPTGSHMDKLAWNSDTIDNYFDLSNPCDFDCNMPEAVNPKYKLGDEVVVGNGQGRPYHKACFWFFGFKNKEYNPKLVAGLKATITAAVYCPTNGENLYALRDSEGNECVICQAGIKLAGIDKQEWLDAASRLFDSWIEISGGYVPKKNDRCYSVSFIKQNKQFTFSTWVNWIDSPFNFETLEQKDQFLSENEKDLKTFWHQV